MRMLAIAIVAALGLGGCTTAQYHADEAQVAATVAAVKNKAIVSESTVASATSIICGYAPLVATEVNNVRAALPTPGAKTVRAFNSADVALASVNAYCAGGGQSGSKIGQLLGVWRAYQAAKTHAAAAKAAAGS